MNKNYSLSILLPVINEYESLIQTINILDKENINDEINYIFILHPSKSKKNSIDLCLDYSKKKPNRFITIFQKKNLLGGAYLDGIEKSNSTHILLMSSDLETDPYLVKQMIKESKNNLKKIICTSRWIENDSFEEYGFVKTYLNKLFQILVKKIFNFGLSDYTYGFRIYPFNCLREFNWKMRNHSFFLEIILFPLKKGYATIELPAKWKKRTEGVSSNKIIYYFSYFKVILSFILK